MVIAWQLTACPPPCLIDSSFDCFERILSHPGHERDFASCNWGDLMLQRNTLKMLHITTYALRQCILHALRFVRICCDFLACQRNTHRASNCLNCRRQNHARVRSVFTLIYGSYTLQWSFFLLSGTFWSLAWKIYPSLFKALRHVFAANDRSNKQFFFYKYECY